MIEVNAMNLLRNGLTFRGSWCFDSNQWQPDSEVALTPRLQSIEGAQPESALPILCRKFRVLRRGIMTGHAVDYHRGAHHESGLTYRDEICCRYQCKPSPLRIGTDLPPTSPGTATDLSNVYKNSLHACA
jgi:hypothetical protein